MMRLSKNSKLYLSLVLFACLLLSTACKKDDDGPSFDDPIGLFDKVWEDFDQHYSYFSHKNIDWDDVYQRYRPQVTESTTANGLGEILGDMTLELRDIHVAVYRDNTIYTFRKRENYAENPPALASNYLDAPIVSNTRSILATVTNTNILYFRLKTLSGDISAYPEIDQMFDLLETKDHLILDLRDNGGGNDGIGKSMAERLLQSGSEVYRHTRRRNGSGRDDFTDWRTASINSNNPINFSGQIIVLTNRGCYSSTEGSILMFRALPNVLLLGDTTGGATANPEVFSLSNGWKYRVSCWQAADPDYNLVEDNGIAPDEVVMMTEESMAENKDLMMERALEILE